MKKNSDPEFAKDSGWSWVILAAAFCSQIIIFGILLCFGIYYVTLLDYFQCTKSQVAVVGSVAYGTKCLTGLLASVLYRKFGCRLVVMTGGLISAIGCFLSFFATDLTHLGISYGFINGFGLGLVFTPTLGILPDYFEKHRYFATAFVTVGSAIGTLLFQPIFLYLINQYGWQGSMLINSGFSLQIVVFGCVMKSRTVVSDLKFSTLLEISLLKNLKFWLLMFDSFLWGGAIFIVFSMANNLMISHGIGKSTTAFLVSLLGLGNTFGRLCSSFIGNFSCTNRPVFYAFSTFAFGVTTFALNWCQSAVFFGIFLMVFGFFFGCMLSQLAGVIMDLFGVSKLVNGIGYAMFACGAGGISVPPMAGTVIQIVCSCIYHENVQNATEIPSHFSRFGDKCSSKKICYFMLGHVLAAIADQFGVEGAFYVSCIMSFLAASLCFCNVLLRYLEQKTEPQLEMEVLNSRS